VIIIDKHLLRVFSMAPRCEYCHQPAKCDPHHAVKCRGHGGGSRLDIKINLAALCRICHTMVGDGHIKKEVIVEIVARREKRTVEEITDAVNLLLRADKNAKPKEIVPWL
jgi:hypothetical protein